MRRLVPAILVSLLAIGWGDPVADNTREGNELYREGKYDEAMAKYVDAQEHAADSPVLIFNLGNAEYKRGKYDAAIEHYNMSGGEEGVSLPAKSFYNLGNSKFRLGQQHWQEALDAYRRTIELVTEHESSLGEEGRKVKRDAQANYEFVLKKLQEQKQQQQQKDKQKDKQKDQQQKQQQKQQDQSKEQKDKEQKQDEQQKPQPQQDKQDKEQEQKQQQQQKDSDQKQRQQQPQQQPQQSKQEQRQQPRMTEEESRRLLAQFREQEEERRRKKQEKGLLQLDATVEKDW